MTAALLAAIVANPDDLESYRVLADQLQAAGDPRGELIALQLARETERSPARAQRLDDAIAAHFGAQGERILGPLRRWTDEAKFSSHWTWRRGFIDTLEADDTVPLLEDVFAHPAAQLLRAISIECEGGEPLDVIAQRAPASVRSLTIDSAGSAAQIWQRFPSLTRLDCTRCALGSDEFPRVAWARLAEASVSALRARWPVLAQLTIEVTPGRPGQSDLVMEMLGSTRFPALARLTFPSPFAEGFVLMLAGSRIGDQLEELDLSGSSLTDAAAQAWAARPRARKLKRLRVLDTSIGYRGREALAAVAERVIVQQGDEYR